VFLSTLGGQQFNLVCCNNDTLACNIPGLLIISSVYRIVNILSPVMTTAPSYIFWVLWKPF
jgi:hypothetical protein